MPAIKNKDFLGLLHDQVHPQGGKWTIARLAAEIRPGRAHVNDVLNNHAGVGGHTRRKLVKVFIREFPMWRAMLATLGWDESGGRIAGDKISTVPQGTSDVRQKIALQMATKGGGG